MPAALSLGILLAVWQAAALLADPRLLPSPAAVAGFMLRETASGDLPFHLGVTLLRVFAAFIVAMAIGSAFGIWLGRSSLADRLFDPWLILLLNLPALVVIVLAYIWLGLNEAAAIGAVALNKIPNAIVTVREGARALDPQLAELAKVYRFSWARRLRHVDLPQLWPYMAAAARSGIALIWKIVLVVELLGRPNGVGFQINLYFQLFDVTAILGYTLAFVTIMLVVELFLMRPVEAHAYRWRPRPA
ncbi:MAG: ABC transporter permease [Parvibaculaceae bacterium]